MPRKATTHRSSTSSKLKQASASKSMSFDITSESIASDLAAFRKQGGKVEVLGNTPMRVNVTAFRSKGNTERKKAAAPEAAKA
ncbi:hypothetical protein ARC78_10635 [Stenotrophomonas pictorum JCM 9942]|uniref:Uncharacterized protein n=1 Tax=Stenotrophomonas pictorum JCM 9942 TaxID=1236960 RepID=A0A0R0AAP5_9GAMM|nr:hypothetical protein [Stenotrophomonas pictorum]KRG41909.1 hypothetical protein ARC78_10635 [Stenotrophomonas pictorum JCM 9942]